MPPFPELKDITPPNPPPFSSPEEVQAVVWQAFGGASALMLLAALWIWWRWRKRRAAPPPLPIPALEELRQKLLGLQSQAASLAPASLGQQVSDTVRSYLQRAHGLLARYRTTEELFGSNRGSRRADAPPPLPFLRPFSDVFARCDSLKFAGADASGTERSSLIELALRAVEEVGIALSRQAKVGTDLTQPPPSVPPMAAGHGGILPAPLPGETRQTATTSPPPEPPPLPAHSPIRSRPMPASPSGAPAIARPGVAPRSDAFTHPQSAAFARGADVIPA
ncbi:MAG: hypothetical protein ACKV19_03945 [Verrucomicrobiales bacterium]